jgi:hypothetical protein
VDLVGVNTDLMVAAGPDLTTYSFVPGSPEMPCVYCGLPNSMTDWASGGSCVIEMPVTVVVSRADEETAQQDLMALINIAFISRFLRFKSEYWSEVAFRSVDRFRATSFGSTECLAADINLSIRTT